MSSSNYNTDKKKSGKALNELVDSSNDDYNQRSGAQGKN